MEGAADAKDAEQWRATANRALLFNFSKCLEISLPSDPLSVSQEQLCFTNL